MNNEPSTLPPSAADGAFVMWDYIKDGLDRIMLDFKHGLSHKYYMQLYTVLYEWGTRGKSTVQPVGFETRPPYGPELETRLAAYFADHNRSLSDSFIDAPVLAQYASLWTTYVASVRKFNRLSSYHNRHWVGAQRMILKDAKAQKEFQQNGGGARRESSYHEPRATLTVAEIAFVQWRENVFHPRKEEIVAALLEAIDRLRSGEEGDTKSIKTVVDSIATLDIDPNGGKSLLFFKPTLEDQLLTSTTAYYASKKDGASPKEVEKWVGEEKERAERLLPKETAEKVLEAARLALA